MQDNLPCPQKGILASKSIFWFNMNVQIPNSCLYSPRSVLLPVLGQSMLTLLRWLYQQNYTSQSQWLPQSNLLRTAACKEIMVIPHINCNYNCLFVTSRPIIHSNLIACLSEMVKLKSSRHSSQINKCNCMQSTAKVFVTQNCTNFLLC